MFKDLDWGWAFKRSGIVVAIYLVLMYVLSNVAPGSFGRGLQTPQQWLSLLPTALVFFFVFAFVYAFIERSRRRRVSEMQGKSGSSPKSSVQEDRDPGPLKGKPNPNQSRRKATRRRR